MNNNNNTNKYKINTKPNTNKYNTNQYKTYHG